MPSPNELWIEAPSLEQDRLTLAATLEAPDGSRRRLWYRLPAEQQPALIGSADPFVVGVLFRAMRSPFDLRVHGRVSPELLRNLAELMSAWNAWYPRRYHRIGILADEERETPPPAGGRAVLGFSSGFDSTFTVWQHCSGYAGRLQVDLAAGVMIQGFDIPLDEPEGFERALQKARRTLASVGLELIPIATNFRELGQNWFDSHGAGLASCLMLLAGRYATGLIASGYKYSNVPLPPAGTNPITDWMFSSGAFRIRSDGSAYTKIEKLRLMYGWTEGMNSLRTCWAGPEWDANCCRCAKCTWSILAFRIAGLPRPASFPRDISNRDILRLRLTDYAETRSLSLLAREARQAGIHASWVRALELCVWLNLQRLTFQNKHPAWGLARRLYRLLLPPFEEKEEPAAL